jgi:hypothetical protein
VRERYEVPRLAPALMECRALVAHYEPAEEQMHCLVPAYGISVRP